MIHTNTLPMKEQGFYPLVPELSRLKYGEHGRRPPRQKFVVDKPSLESCWGQHVDSVAWAAGSGLVLGTAFQVSVDPPNSADELFRKVAEKVSNKIVMDRRIYGGAPCVANTRVPVYAILELVEAGYTHKRILKSFPSIGQEGLAAALQFAVLVMER